MSGGELTNAIPLARKANGLTGFGLTGRTRYDGDMKHSPSSPSFCRRSGGAASNLFWLVVLAAAGLGVFYAIKLGDVKFQQARVAKVVELLPVKNFMQDEEAIKYYILANIAEDAPNVLIDPADVRVSKTQDTLTVELDYVVPVHAGPIHREHAVSDRLTKSFTGYATAPIRKAHEATGYSRGAGSPTSKAEEAARQLSGGGSSRSLGD